MSKKTKKNDPSWSNLKASFNHDVRGDYVQLVDKMRPLDIIAFNGADIVSDIVDLAQKYFLGSGEFTHVAMVVTDEILPYKGLEPGKIYIWESTISGDPFGLSDDVVTMDTGKCYMGVQLRDLEEVLYKYLSNSGTSKAFAAWCPLYNNPCNRKPVESDSEYESRMHDVKTKFREIFDTYHHRSYELDVANMLASIYKPARWYRDAYNSFTKRLYEGLRWLRIVGPREQGPSGWQFCSELITRVYQEYGIISNEYDPSNAVPMDFFGFDEDGMPNITDNPVYINELKISDLSIVVHEKEPKYHNKRAFLVGINYRGSECELNGCINDVDNFKKVLINVYKYNPANILILTDDTLHKPTKVNILAGWRWLFSSLPAKDFEGDAEYEYSVSTPTAYYFHYSGHGCYVKDRDGDEKDGFDEVLCPIDCDDNGFIIDDDIRKLLADKVDEKSRLVCTMDCCHSGTSIDLQYNAKVNHRNRVSLEVDDSYEATTGDVIMISGCKDEQTSADVSLTSDQAVGALSYSLLAVLEKWNYKIKFDNLIIQILDHIKCNNLSDQIPCLSFGKWTNIKNEYQI